MLFRSELAAEGLVKFVDNPRHLRSKLVQLTPKGEAHYDDMSARFRKIASTLGAGLGETDVRSAAEVLRRLSADVKERADRLP